MSDSVRLPFPASFLRFGLGLWLYSVVCGFHELEYHCAVGDVDGGAAQFLVERRVVEQVQVLQHQQPGCLEIGVESKHRAQLVEGFPVESFGVVYQLCQFHFLTNWLRLR